MKNRWKTNFSKFNLLIRLIVQPINLKSTGRGEETSTSSLLLWCWPESVSPNFHSLENRPTNRRIRACGLHGYRPSIKAESNGLCIQLEWPLAVLLNRSMNHLSQSNVLFRNKQIIAKSRDSPNLSSFEISALDRKNLFICWALVIFRISFN